MLSRCNLMLPRFALAPRSLGEVGNQKRTSCTSPAKREADPFLVVPKENQDPERAQASRGVMASSDQQKTHHEGGFFHPPAPKATGGCPTKL